MKMTKRSLNRSHQTRAVSKETIKSWQGFVLLLLVIDTAWLSSSSCHCSKHSTWGIVGQQRGWESVCKLIRWCFEPSRPQKITSGLKTNFGLSPSYWFHKSLYHTSLFLKLQLKLYPPFRNANPEEQQHIFYSLFIFCGHSTREPASSRVTYLLCRPTKEPV